MSQDLETSQILTPSQIEDIRLAPSKMQGANRRAFQAEMVLKYCRGSARLSETILLNFLHNLKLALKGATLSMTEGILAHFEVIRSLPNGHLMAILETIKKLGLDKIISEKSSRIRNLVVAMIVARIINPKSKLATARGFNSETGSQSLGQLLDLEKADEDELYNALDWLLEKPEKIEKQLTLKQLESGTLVLYAEKCRKCDRQLTRSNPDQFVNFQLVFLY